VGAEGERDVIAVRAALVLALGACGGKKSAPPAEEVATDEDAALEAVELDVAVEAGDVALRLEMRAVSPVRHDVMYLDEMYSEAWLVTENKSGRRLAIAYPSYLYAKLPGYEYPYTGEGCLPDEQFLFAAPTDEVTMPADGELGEHVLRIWYLGNSMRPPPHAAGGGGAPYEVRAAPEEDGLVRLAVRLEDEPALAARAFTIAGGCTPEDWLLAGLGDDPVDEIDAIEQHLRFAGYAVGSRFPIFTKLRAKRGGVFP
jgi:hypothetical protein